MADLFFPQLASGAIAQYPIRKNTAARVIRNVLPDGSLQLSPDAAASHIVWQLAYQALSGQEVSALSTHFNACQGRFHAFTFIDPTDNLLTNSANCTAAPWIADAGLTIAPNAADPLGNTGAFVLTNNAQTAVRLSQTVAVPASYQYCFSVYALSAQAGSVSLGRSGPSSQQTDTLAVGPAWSRIVSSGSLADNGTGFTVSINLSPGQQITIYGLQFEAQLAPSRYRATLERSGVYPNAHWAVDALPVISDAPNLFSTIFTIEAAI